MNLTVRENVTLPRIGAFFRRGKIDYRAERFEARRVISSFEVRPPEEELPFGSLSGGNQQKAILGKWMSLRPQVLLLHEPTQGVDIGARKEIFAKLRAAADDGAAIVVSSIEYDDLANLCNRILVFRDGAVASELSGDRLTKAAVLTECLKTGDGEAASRRLEARA